MKALTKLEENVLLTILKLKDNAYIVSIKEQLEEFMEKEISFGALYVSLDRLKKAGFLNSEVGESTSVRGGKAKKFYRLTSNGLTVLQEIQKRQKELWKDFNRLADEFIEA